MLDFDVTPHEVRAVMCGTRLTEAEHDRLKAAAKKRGMHVATVIRQLSLAWADRVLHQESE